MTPQEAELLRQQGYALEGTCWVRRIPPSKGRTGLRVELLAAEPSWYRVRAVASESSRWYSGLLVDRVHFTLGQALSDPGVAALEAAVRMGATLEDLGRGGW